MKKVTLNKNLDNPPLYKAPSHSKSEFPEVCPMQRHKKIYQHVSWMLSKV